jgi:uncharacterized protein (TIGR01319 family)
VRQAVFCADVGSTFTKVAAVDVADGELIGTAQHPTTAPPWGDDVLSGLDAAIADIVGRTGVSVGGTHVCSSAGGGLRLAVVGYEPLVTAQAGQRVGLSAGARVVRVAAGPLDRDGLRALADATPDVVLLVGGTDGGDADVLRHNASMLARTRTPIVVAGNSDARAEAVALLSTRDRPVLATENVLPRIGVLNAQPARAAIRSVFLRHVIGGKGLSKGRRFAALVRGATPDIVLTAVELVADTAGVDLAVLDAGGATTDVYSVLSPDPNISVLNDDVAGTLWHSRTVEGDLGLRWSAPGIVDAALAERLLNDAGPWTAETVARAENPTFLPATVHDREAETQLTTWAAVVAMRRHARGESTVDKRRDLSRLRLLIGSGGVLRRDASAGERVLRAVLSDNAGGWPLPRHAIAIVDREYLLAPIGLLAADHPAAARALATRLLETRV